MQLLSLAEKKQYAFPEPESIHSIDEVILSGSLFKSGKLLKSLLNDLANDPQDQRWLTLILSGEQAGNTISWLKTNGLKNQRLQVLNHSAKADPFKLTQKALASGTSHTVVSWVNELTSRELSELECAARSGQCHALAIRNR
ncbi:hypothetical protein [Endozoicomonas ascidiicola]|uniref:hypothetical protein n=1 Tax=Endozoicomonas ascidiicola TaxID=1698521 RepID=UPI000831E41B|nr:hypothetical protein [Endozoicomonas ascidiicola]